MRQAAIPDKRPRDPENLGKVGVGGRSKPARTEQPSCSVRQGYGGPCRAVRVGAGVFSCAADNLALRFVSCGDTITGPISAGPTRTQLGRRQTGSGAGRQEGSSQALAMPQGRGQSQVGAVVALGVVAHLGELGKYLISCIRTAEQRNTGEVEFRVPKTCPRF